MVTPLQCVEPCRFVQYSEVSLSAWGGGGAYASGLVSLSRQGYGVWTKGQELGARVDPLIPMQTLDMARGF